MSTPLEQWREARNASLEDSRSRIGIQANGLWEEAFILGYNKASQDLLDGKLQMLVDEVIRNNLSSIWGLTPSKLRMGEKDVVNP